MARTRPRAVAPRRGVLNVRFYHATSALTLHCLVGPDKDGYFRFERNTDAQAPMGSSFETPHHVFCNITEVPLCVIVNSDEQQFYVGTFYQPPAAGTRHLGQIRIRY